MIRCNQVGKKFGESYLFSFPDNLHYKQSVSNYIFLTNNKGKWAINNKKLESSYFGSQRLRF